jgi:hypothetical protein
MAHTQPSLRQQLATWLYRRFAVGDPIPTPTIGDDPRLGWLSLNRQGVNDRNNNERLETYRAALDAWRHNPLAKQIVSIISDFLVTEEVRPTASGDIGRFIDRFWEHEENQMATRLPDLMDELSRSGNLFIVLFRNPIDGMSYVRVVPASEILDIETAANDWEKETAFYQYNTGGEPRRWLGPDHPDAAGAEAVMVHYAINRPVGALYGESELTTILAWLKRYNRMLEDRVRLNFAVRAFHWLVKVPSHKVGEKQAQYSIAPEPGAIIVHDDNEEWQVVAPKLQAADASHDLKAMRMLIAAGSGQPPFWHGDANDVNLATARVMQEPALRRLKRRQLHTRQIVIDLCYVAYLRSVQQRKGRTRPDRGAISLKLTDLTRDDNRTLGDAARQVTEAMTRLMEFETKPSKTLHERILRMIFSFAGEPLTEEEVGKIMNETEFVYIPPDPFGNRADTGTGEEDEGPGHEESKESGPGAKKAAAGFQPPLVYALDLRGGNGRFNGSGAGGHAANGHGGRDDSHLSGGSDE